MTETQAHAEWREMLEQSIKDRADVLAERDALRQQNAELREALPGCKWWAGELEEKE